MEDRPIKHGDDPLKRYRTIKAVKSRERAYETWLRVAPADIATKLAREIGGIHGKSKRARRNRGLYIAAKRANDKEAFWNDYLNHAS